MTQEEFIKGMKELGWDDDFINEQIQIIADAEKKGITVPYDLEMFDLSMDDTTL
jgi:hypothetical protein